MLMNYEFGKMWKEVAITDFKALPEHLLGRTEFLAVNEEE